MLGRTIVKAIVQEGNTSSKIAAHTDYLQTFVQIFVWLSFSIVTLSHDFLSKLKTRPVGKKKHVGHLGSSWEPTFQGLNQFKSDGNLVREPE